MQDDIIVYDKAKWHHEGDYPKGLPEENAFTHTGMFLAWLADRGLLSPAFVEDFQEELQQLNERRITPGRFFQIVDGVLASDMLNDDGNTFSGAYYTLENKYFDDYQDILVLTLPSVYHVADTWENCEKLKATIDRRYNEWRQSNGEH
jgi:hypothetical protein